MKLWLNSIANVAMPRGPTNLRSSPIPQQGIRPLSN